MHTFHSWHMHLTNFIVLRASKSANKSNVHQRGLFVLETRTISSGKHLDKYENGCYGMNKI
jgi:hypothetical protein